MIRRSGIFLLAAFAFAGGCVDDEPAAPALELPVREVYLAGAEGAATELAFTARTAWSASTADSRYAVEPLAGDAGEVVVTLTALEDNDLRSSRELFPLEIAPRGGEALRVGVVQRPCIVPQALFFFFVGTDLQWFFDRNMDDALAAMHADLPGEGRVAAFCRQEGGWRIVELLYDASTGSGVRRTLRKYDDLDRSDPALFSRVIADMQQLVPARDYGLILGGHGTGWLPVGYSPYGPGWRALSPARRIAPDGKPYPVTRYFGEKGSMFDIADIARSLAATGTVFRYIIFDDCFMSNIETLWDLRGNARTIIASPTEIMGDGFPYRKVLPSLMARGGTAVDLEGVCQAFYRYYLEEYDPDYASGCIAACACGELEALAAATRHIIETGTRPCDASVLQSFEGLDNHLFYDFRQYIEQIARDQGALAAFVEQFDRTFPPAMRLHTPSFYSVYAPASLLPITYYSGVSCSAPSDVYPEENRATAWWQAVR